MDRCPDLGEVGPRSAGVGTCRVAGLIGGLAYPGSESVRAPTSRTKTVAAAGAPPITEANEPS
ncbi:MAG: hypothetical protein ACXVX5_11450, partial [Mycobacterium sp.]